MNIIRKKCWQNKKTMVYYRTPARAAWAESDLEKSFWKTFKNLLTNRWGSDIISRSSQESAAQADRMSQASKKVWKNFKKGVDKREAKWYNIQAVSEKSRTGKAPWKLNNNDNCVSEKKHSKTPKNSFEFIWTLIISKEPKTALRDVIRGNPVNIQFFREFDPGSGWTLAACITHSSRTELFPSGDNLVADGWVTREQPALHWGITAGNGR